MKARILGMFLAVGLLLALPTGSAQAIQCTRTYCPPQPKKHCAPRRGVLRCWYTPAPGSGGNLHPIL